MNRVSVQFIPMLYYNHNMVSSLNGSFWANVLWKKDYHIERHNVNPLFTYKMNKKMFDLGNKYDQC